MNDKLDPRSLLNVCPNRSAKQQARAEKEERAFKRHCGFYFASRIGVPNWVIELATGLSRKTVSSLTGSASKKYHGIKELYRTMGHDAFGKEFYTATIKQEIRDAEYAAEQETQNRAATRASNPYAPKLSDSVKHAIYAAFHNHRDAFGDLSGGECYKLLASMFGVNRSSIHRLLNNECCEYGPAKREYTLLSAAEYDKKYLDRGIVERIKVAVAEWGTNQADE